QITKIGAPNLWGWLADRTTPRTTLFLATGIGALGGAALPYLIHMPGLPLWLHMIFWGGVITTIYTIGTIVLGHEHKEANLASATLAFVLMYGIGSIMGPTLSSEAIEAFGTQGLPWVMGLACAFTFVFTAWRTYRGHHQ
ncbi:MAG: MFS transporter, partial [Rickettsiales bacterium]